MGNFKEEVERLKNLSIDDFKAYIDPLRSEIYSFPGMYPPGDALFIGNVLRGNEMYSYFLAPDGNMYFETASGFAEKKRMNDIHFKLLRE